MNGFSSNKSIRTMEHVLIFTFLIVVGAQLNVNLFISDFKCSLGVVMMPVFLMLFGKYPMIPVTVLSSVSVFLSRILVFWIQNGKLLDSPINYYPEIFFYLVYGTLFFLYNKKKNYTFNSYTFIFLLLFDYLSNLSELLFRVHTMAFQGRTQLSILLVALFRSALIWCIYLALRYYKFSLLRLEHAQRYQRLLLLISKLNEEVIWMRKNTGLIETTMHNSYRLYQTMQDEQMDPELSKTALSVAKDIHEIKKEYNLILRGLSEALDLNLKEEGMHLSDILTILQSSLNVELMQESKKIILDSEIQEDLYTENHYFILSILRNLFTNAAEASDKDVIHLTFTQTSDDKNHYFTVGDDGPGIHPDDVTQIFSPGFSTKINYDTGEVSRGLGLNLVQDLIENQWNGAISVTSVPGNTTFSFQIPKSIWEGK